MILDTGICSVFRAMDMALSGEMPRKGYGLIGKSWYGELSFETSPASPTDGRQEFRTDARIRLLQNRSIRQDDVVILRDLPDWNSRGDADPVYRITRAYHGADDAGTTLITDLTLEVYRP